MGKVIEVQFSGSRRGEVREVTDERPSYNYLGMPLDQVSLYHQQRAKIIRENVDRGFYPAGRGL